MAVWHYTIRQLTRSVMSLVLALQILLCSLTFVNLMGLFQYRHLKKRMINESFSDGLYIAIQRTFEESFHYDTPAQHSAVVEEEMQAVALAYPEVKRVIPTAKNFWAYEYRLEDGTLLPDMNVNMYAKELLDLARIPLSKGAFWDTEKTYTSAEEIPVVISRAIEKNMPLGSLHTVTVDGLRYEGDQAVGVLVSLRLRVVGVMHKANPLWFYSSFAFNSYGSSFDVHRNHIVMPDLADEVGKNMATYENATLITEFEPGAGKSPEEFVTELQDQGILARILREEPVPGDWQRYLSPAMMFIFLFILTLTGIGGNNGMARRRNEREYAVFFAEGASWQQCVWMDALRNLLIIVVPATAATVYHFVQYEKDTIRMFVLNGWTVVAVVVMMALVYLISSLSFILRTKKTNPAETIKRWE